MFWLLGTLLNEVIGLVFTKEELRTSEGLGLRKSKGTEKALDSHRVDAIRGEMFATKASFYFWGLSLSRLCRARIC